MDFILLTSDVARFFKEAQCLKRKSAGVVSILARALIKFRLKSFINAVGKSANLTFGALALHESNLSIALNPSPLRST